MGFLPLVRMSCPSVEETNLMLWHQVCDQKKGLLSSLETDLAMRILMHMIY
jgi:hypothetical protein